MQLHLFTSTLQSPGLRRTSSHVRMTLIRAQGGKRCRSLETTAERVSPGSLSAAGSHPCLSHETNHLIFFPPLYFHRRDKILHDTARMISAASLGSHMWDLLKIAVSSYAYPARMAMHRRRTHKESGAD